MSTRLSRRELISRFGLVAGSLPMLDALSGNRAWAAAQAKRLVSIVVQHGIFAQHWLPFIAKTMPVSTQSPGNLLAAPSTFLQKVDFEQRTGCTAIDLSTRSAALSPILSSKWQAIKSKTAFINNLGCSHASLQGHTATAMLGGYKNDDSKSGTVDGYNLTGETIDVVIARKLNGRLPLSLKIPNNIDDVHALEWGVGVSVLKRTSGFGLLPALSDPIKTWDKLFADYVPPVTGPKKRDPAKRRVALLERALASIAQVERDQRLSAYDRQRLDAHAALLEGQRAALSTTQEPNQPTSAAPPSKPLALNPDEAATFNATKGTLFKAQFKNAAAALKMNKEQVITINTGLEDEFLSDGLKLSGSQAYHANAGHLSNPSTAIIDECRKVQLFIFDVIADFLAELDAVEDPATGATYLDNTLVLITPEHDGRPNGHLRAAVPSILVGGFGTFRGGRLYDFSRPNLWGDTPSCIYIGYSYSRLLYTVLQAFGVTATERASLDIQGVAQTWDGADLTDFTVPLPGLV